MTSSPDALPVPRTSRESVLLRGASAASATPWQREHRPAPAAQSGRPVVPSAPVATVEPISPLTGADTTPTATRPAPAAPPAAVSATWSESPAEATPYTGAERRSGEDRRLRSRARLSDVYAEQLDQLREQARSQGWAAGHAEGVTAAAGVVAAAEAAAEVQLAEAQARWERRLATATAALGAAAAGLEATVAPVVDELRDTVLDAVVTLVGDLLGRELATTGTAGLDAVRRALTLCPTDVPVVVRLHPDDLAEVASDELAKLPASVTVLGDLTVERAGALAEAGTTRVDAQLGVALERVRTVLRS
ncbi:flagellar assembly protein FliH [Modestobacter sp. DSM 44400]|uniref:FliH/SctL family protein n=1 Tax=Modestobacter sp. DSM 44400 TaxID=1550230 RepID=UPI00089B6E20|nr:FliH/SctL family protein [Modestobacter sp. DSM 44400]SDX87747.1 flagellar assembly protein FliH [Modestobacter sp. DSM 44400]